MLVGLESHCGKKYSKHERFCYSKLNIMITERTFGYKLDTSIVSRLKNHVFLNLVKIQTQRKNVEMQLN